MKKFKRILFSCFCVLLVILNVTVTAFAHSGRTDSSGGHKDNKNKSGLGSYHYHCGGYPAHLHDNGYCPYTDVLPSGVTISVEKNTLGIGEKVSISGTVSPSNACNTNISWACSDPNVVQLNNGVIEAVGYGTATITGTSFNGKVGSVTITVKEITANQVLLHDTVESLYIGENAKFTAEIVPANVDNPSIQWTTSDEKIATVDANGLVNAIASGTAVISAVASNGVAGTYTLTVQEKFVETIEIVEENKKIFLGDTYKLKAKITPEDATNPSVVWNSSDTSIAEVSENGTLKAVGCGDVTITATSSNGLSDSVTITVNEIAAEKMEIEVDSTIILGESAQAKAIFYPEDATVQEVQWSVDDEKIASIDANGLIQANQIGEVTITAEQKDVSATIEIEVVPRLVEEIVITSSLGDSVHVGDISEFSAEVKPENATYTEVFWESSNPEVAVIDENGKLEAKSIGQTVITAFTKDGYTQAYEVNVLLTDQSVMMAAGGFVAVVAGGVVCIKKKKGKKKAKIEI